MDKQTLSNYGWLVIVTLILAVMLALATPFGTYVGDAVVSVANGYVGASNNAMDDDNIAANQEKWESKLDFGVFEDEVVAGAKFANNAFDIFLTWDELKVAENSDNYGGWNVENVTDNSIGEYAFMECPTIQEVIIPKGVTSIDEYAFDTTFLTSVTIPNTVENIGFYAFNCPILNSITFNGTIEQWNAIQKDKLWNGYDACCTYITCIDGIVTC